MQTNFGIVQGWKCEKRGAFEFRQISHTLLNYSNANNYLNQ